jgi:DnaJ-class molecular chaperone
MPPDSPNSNDEDDEETTSPDHDRASVICPHCGGVGKLEDGKKCDVCRGECVLDKKAYDRWRTMKK